MESYVQLVLVCSVTNFRNAMATKLSTYAFFASELYENYYMWQEWDNKSGVKVRLIHHMEDLSKYIFLL